MNVNIIYYFLYTQLGRTPLSLACAHGLSDVSQLLINKGTSFDVTDGVSYYLHLNNLNSVSHFVIYFTVRASVNVNIFSYFLYTVQTYSSILGL